MVSGSLALLYFFLGLHGGRQGSGPDRGQSPVEWGDFPSVRPSIRPSVHPSIGTSIGRSVGPPFFFVDIIDLWTAPRDSLNNKRNFSNS